MQYTRIAFLIALGLLGFSGCDDGGGPGCPPGELNCPCDDQGGCQGDLVCREGFCVPGVVCPEGTAGCPCRAGDGCDQDLVCEGGVCRPAGGLGVTVGDQGVRACDLLVDAGDSGASSVVFNGNTVIGAFRREGSRFALAFTAKQDGPFSAAVAWLAGEGGQAIDAGQVSLSQVVCYGRLGTRIDDPDLKLE